MYICVYMLYICVYIDVHVTVMLTVCMHTWYTFIHVHVCDIHLYLCVYDIYVYILKYVCMKFTHNWVTTLNDALSTGIK